MKFCTFLTPFLTPDLQLLELYHFNITKMLIKHTYKQTIMFYGAYMHSFWLLLKKLNLPNEA